MHIDYTWAIYTKIIVPFNDETGYSIYAQWVKIGTDSEGVIGYYTDEFNTECRPTDKNYIEKQYMNDFRILLLVTESLSKQKSAEIDQEILTQIENKSAEMNIEVNTHVLT
jgi:hypothetical protein